MVVLSETTAPETVVGRRPGTVVVTTAGRVVIRMVSGVWNAGEVERVEVVVGVLTVPVVGTSVVVVDVVGLIIETNSCGREILAEVVSHNRAVRETGGDVVLEIAGPAGLNVDLGELVVPAVAPTPVLSDADVTLTVVRGATIAVVTE